MNIYSGSCHCLLLQLDKSSGDFCYSNLLLPLQCAIRQTERRLWSIQFAKGWTSQGHKQSSVSDWWALWCCLLNIVSWCWHMKLTGVLAATRDFFFSCCSYRSLMGDLYISLDFDQVLLFSKYCKHGVVSRFSCSSRSADYSQRLSTPLAHSVVRLMDSWIALRNLEIFACFTCISRSIGYSFAMEHPIGDVWDLSLQWSMQPTCTFQAGVRVFTKAFARVIVHLKKKGPFCSYYPPQEECLAPGILEK